MATNFTYVCLLRGINVTGHKVIKMESLRAAFEALGFADVKSYVQSGNVVFKAPASAKLAEKIQAKVLREFGFSVPVLVKTREEISAVIKGNPFVKDKNLDLSRLHVAFLSHGPEKSALKMLDKIAAGQDRYRCAGEVVYLHCPNGYGETKLSNNVFEKVLSVTATTRNWNTVNRLREMMRD
jgi:uncharacterized protein (DUF1697 family)